MARFYGNEDKLGSLEDVQNDIDDDYCQVNVSPLSKLRRVSLVKQSRGHKKTQHGLNEDGEDDFGCENESLPSKSRRISLVKRVSMKNELAVKGSDMGKKKEISRLLAACKELVNLAVKRGTLDDITVVIVDLKHYRLHI